MENQILSAVTIPGVTGLVIDIPDPGGIFSGGLLSGIGVILQIVFSLILVVWVVMSILAGYKIIQSQGNPDKIQEGITRIKSIWLSVTIFFGFFIVLTIIGVFVGYGSPIEWGNTLAQCGGYSGPFYFSQIDEQKAWYYTKFGTEVGTGQKGYCCVYSAGDNDYKGNADSPLGNISNLGINNDGYNWYLPFPVTDGVKTYVDATTNKVVIFPGDDNTGFSNCRELGK